MTLTSQLSEIINRRSAVLVRLVPLKKQFQCPLIFYRVDVDDDSCAGKSDDDAYECDCLIQIHCFSIPLVLFEFMFVLRSGNMVFMLRVQLLELPAFLEVYVPCDKRGTTGFKRG